MPTVSINGTELYYVTVGEGVPCLVMHGGLGFDHTYLHPWLDPLGDTLHLIYYDHRGNGRSGRPAKETMAILRADYSSDEEMRQKFPKIWPLYFKTFNADIAHRLLENSIINALAEHAMGSWRLTIWFRGWERSTFPRFLP